MTTAPHPESRRERLEAQEQREYDIAELLAYAASRDLRYYGIKQSAFNRADEHVLSAHAVEHLNEEGLQRAFALAIPLMSDSERSEVAAKLRNCPPKARS